MRRVGTSALLLKCALVSMRPSEQVSCMMSMNGLSCNHSRQDLHTMGIFQQVYYSCTWKYQDYSDKVSGTGSRDHLCVVSQVGRILPHPPQLDDEVFQLNLHHLQRNGSLLIASFYVPFCFLNLSRVELLIAHFSSVRCLTF